MGKTIDHISRMIATWWVHTRTDKRNYYSAMMYTIGYSVALFLLGSFNVYPAVNSSCHLVCVGLSIIWFYLFVLFYRKNRFNYRMEYRGKSEDSFFTLLEKTEKELNNKKKEIEERERWLQLIVRSINKGMLAVNENGIITLCNPAASGMLGFTMDELVGTSIGKLIPKYQKECITKFLSNPAVRKEQHLTSAITKDHIKKPIELVCLKAKYQGTPLVVFNIQPHLTEGEMKHE